MSRGHDGGLAGTWVPLPWAIAGPSVPNIARVYDAWLGGKSNYAMDRAVADQVAELAPWVAAGAKANRAFLHRAVSYLTRVGIHQFVDLGSGLPTMRNVHEVAQEGCLSARVVYVDIDPVVVAHARALLATDDRTVVVQGDFRCPETILGEPSLRAHVDFSEPVAVLLAAALHLLPDSDDPAGIVRTVREAMPPDSHVVISHVSPGEPTQAEAMRAAVEAYSDAVVPFTPRTHVQVQALFEGFELVPPGVVPAQRWRPRGSLSRTVLPLLGGVGRLPGGGIGPRRLGGKKAARRGGAATG